MHCSPRVRVDYESNATPVHPITAGSAKLPDWLIREAEETLENNIRGPTTKAIGYTISLHPQHENSKIERIVRKRR